MTTAPARPTPTRPTTPAKPTTAAPKTSKYTTSTGYKAGGKRVVVHGPPSSGKTSLCALIDKSKFIDRDSDGTAGLDVSRVDGVQTFDDVLEALNTPDLWKDVDTIVLDSGTAMQELATLKVVGQPKPGETPKSIESFGFGKGYRMVYETMQLLLAALDRHVEQGRNVVLICHSIAGTTPNPSGEDYLQHQLALQQTNQGQLRTRVEGWAEHVFFISRDVSVAEGTNKGKSSGSRTIQTVWSPSYVAKTRSFMLNGEKRSLPPEIEYYDPRVYPVEAAEVWRLLGFNK